MAAVFDRPKVFLGGGSRSGTQFKLVLFFSLVN